MNQSLFRFIWTNSRKQQIATIVLTFLSLPVLYLSLELPKQIINEAIAGESWPRVIAGQSIEQVPALLCLCVAFISLVVLNAYLRHRVNLRKSRISVDLLSHLRETLMTQVMRFPLAQFKRMAPGDITNMVISETSSFGRFFGDSIAVPVFEGLKFTTILTFVFMQDFYLGLAAIALLPGQGAVVLRLQRRVNQLTEEIVIRERSLSSRITEVVDGVQDVHAQDGSAHFLEGIRRRLARLTAFRMEASSRASFMKFCNTILGQTPPFLFYLVGGWLVIIGDLSFGALVAALAAHQDLAEPTDDLVAYYRDFAESLTKFGVVMRQFEPGKTTGGGLEVDRPDTLPRLQGPIEAVGLDYVDEDGRRVLSDVNFRFENGEKILVLSDSGGASDVAAALLSRLCLPTGGSLQFSHLEASELHQSIAGTRIALLNSQPAFFNTTLGENVFIGLSNPASGTETSDPLYQWTDTRHLNRVPASPDHPWIDPQLGGLPDRAALRARTLELIQILEIDEDLYALGLGQRFKSPGSSDFAEQIVAARADVHESLARLKMQDLIQPFDWNRFNTYSTVAENIMFGEAIDSRAVSDESATGPILRRLLKELDLQDSFLQIGTECAKTLVELLGPLPAGHPFFDQYSLVTEATLPDLTTIVRQVEQHGMHRLSEKQRQRLINLTFNIAPQRHRLGLMDEDFQQKIVNLRHELHRRYPNLMEQESFTYRSDRYNARLSILSNLIFGSIMFSRVRGEARVREIINKVVENRGLRDAIVLEGLEARVGVGGQRLSVSVRQKLGILRSLLKRPDILVVNNMLNALDDATRTRLTDRVLEETVGATVIWVDTVSPKNVEFDQSYRITEGQLLPEEPQKKTSPISPIQTASSLESSLDREAAVLRDVPLLASLDWPGLKLLAFTSKRQDYRAGEILFEQGDTGEAAYVVLTGQADVVVEGENSSRVLYSLGQGQMVGELAMLSQMPRSATVRAKTDLRLLRLDREIFFETMRQNPAFSFEVSRDLGARLVATTEALRNE